MKLTLITLLIGVLGVLVACSSKEDGEAQRAPTTREKTKKVAVKAPPPALPDAAPAVDAKVEPKTPEEIALARKSAMVEGRDADVIKYCEMEGLEAGKGDPQALLGCTLAACRIEQKEKARAWAKGLPKALKKQAFKICKANGVFL